jgi:hypothetical protein
VEVDPALGRAVGETRVAQAVDGVHCRPGDGDAREAARREPPRLASARDQACAKVNRTAIRLAASAPSSTSSAAGRDASSARATAAVASRPSGQCGPRPERER